MYIYIYTYDFESPQLFHLEHGCSLHLALLCFAVLKRACIFVSQSGGHNHVPQIHEHYYKYIYTYREREGERFAFFGPYTNPSRILTFRVGNRLSTRNRNRLLGESETVIVVISVGNPGG